MLTSRLPLFSSVLRSADPLQWELQLGDRTRAVSQRQQRRCPPHTVPSGPGLPQPEPFLPTRPRHRLLVDFGAGKGKIAISPSRESGKLNFETTSVCLWAFISTTALLDPLALCEDLASKPGYSNQGNLQIKHRYIFLSSRLRPTDPFQQDRSCAPRGGCRIVFLNGRTGAVFILYLFSFAHKNRLHD